MQLTSTVSRSSASSVRPARARTGLRVVSSVAVDTQVATKPSVSVDELRGKATARAKAMIALEEMELASRPKVRISLRSRVGLGEVWKVVGDCPEFGRMIPEVAPSMRWTEGDVWVLETPVREGTHTYKAVLRNSDGAYIWETGSNRTLEVTAGLDSSSTLNCELDVKMPF